MILTAAFGAVIGNLAAGHGDKVTGLALYDFDVADDETTINRDACKGKEFVIGLRHKLNFYFSNIHNSAPDPIN